MNIRSKLWYAIHLICNVSYPVSFHINLVLNLTQITIIRQIQNQIMLVFSIEVEIDIQIITPHHHIYTPTPTPLY